MPMELWHDELQRRCSSRKAKERCINQAVSPPMISQARLQVHSQS